MSKGMNKAQKKFFVGASLLVFAIGFLIYSGVKASGTYYYTVSEVLSMDPRAKKVGLRLEGKVIPGSIVKDAENLKLNFSITDESNKSMTVLWKGVVPDMFQDDIDVVVEGSVDESGKFIANKLLTSCPSKYEAAKKVKESI
jgi:cytochrome c-type biogenesis protein CcmE